MYQALKALTTAAFAVTLANQSPAQAQEDPVPLEYDASGIATGLVGVDGGTYYYELLNQNGCEAIFYIVSEIQPIPDESKLKTLKEKLMSAFRRGTMEELFQDKNFLGTVSTASYFCEETTSFFPGKGITKYPLAFNYYPDNGQIYRLEFAKGKGTLDGRTAELIARAFLEGKLPTDPIFGVMGIQNLEFAGCLKEYKNGQSISEECTPNK